MNLGAFSASLNVKNIADSLAFYEKLGFKIAGGNQDDNWLILKNGEHVIGLFQGMFDKNLLTFNPGWNQEGEELESFTDIRELERQLLAQGIKPTKAVDASTSGPGSMLLVDPDGNPILIDQHR